MSAYVHQLFETFGNPAAVERAIEQAMPNLKAQNQLHERIEAINKLLAKERTGRRRVGDLVCRGKLTPAEADKALDDGAQRIKRMEADKENAQRGLTNAPTPAQIRETAKLVASKFRRRVPPEFVRANARITVVNQDIARMSPEDGRTLVKRVFGGKTPEGLRAGVYIECPEGKGKDKSIKYKICGLIQRSGVSTALPPDPRNPDRVVAELQAEVLTKCALRWRTTPACAPV